MAAMTFAMVCCFVTVGVLLLTGACFKPRDVRRRAAFGLALAFLVVGLALGFVKAKEGERLRQEARDRGLPAGGQ
jgi:preprotein translocase subunit SecG